MYWGISDIRAGMGAIALLILPVCPALAATSPITAYYPDPNVPVLGPASATMTIDVIASVGGRCGFATGAAPNGSVDAGLIDTQSWTGQVPFTAQCTAPWRIAVASQHGALKAAGSINAAGYLDKAPYDVTLNVVADAGTVNSTCTAASVDQALSSSACAFRGTASASNGLLISRSFNLSGSYIEVSAPAYAGPGMLVSGTYGDTLTITVSPAS